MRGKLDATGHREIVNLVNTLIGPEDEPTPEPQG
jgi:hypothetical protein